MSEATASEEHVEVPPTKDTATTNVKTDSIMDQPEKSYSIFTKNEKRIIVAMIAAAGLFSPLTANIYLPAIPSVADAFHKSVELINLTVTMYMVLQGLSPMVWGAVADRWGRRPIFVACLLLLCLSCVGLALVPTSAYWLLLLLRCVQAAGSASTVTVGAGVIVDIATPEERGGFFGLYSIGPLIGPSIGPIIGGVIADTLGWRAIFWFLCICSAVCLVFLVLVLPETLRVLVGDGSVVPSAIYRPLLPVIGRNRRNTTPTSKPMPQPFRNPIRFLLYPDVLILLLVNGIIYASFYGVTASLSILFKKTYPYLNETDIGLCFLALGGGLLVGSISAGKFLDYDYKKIKQKLMEAAEADPETKVSGKDVTKDENFPIEQARLRTLPYSLSFYIACTVAYGWCLERKASIAAPLALHFGIGLSSIFVMNSLQTLSIDLVPSNGSSVTACNNLVRCSLGAALVAVINIVLDALGAGWTYVLLGGVCVLVIPVLFLQVRLGPGWRRARLRKAELESAQQS